MATNFSPCIYNIINRHSVTFAIFVQWNFTNQCATVCNSIPKKKPTYCSIGTSTYKYTLVCGVWILHWNQLKRFIVLLTAKNAIKIEEIGFFFIVSSNKIYPSNVGYFFFFFRFWQQINRKLLFRSFWRKISYSLPKRLIHFAKRKLFRNNFRARVIISKINSKYAKKSLYTCIDWYLPFECDAFFSLPQVSFFFSTRYYL